MVHEGTTDGMQDCKVKAIFSQNRTTSERETKEKRRAKAEPPPTMNRLLYLPIF
ncbi:hypothetical protein HanRHA438_Chr14g0659991 [Helianthus annuus]|nr:hypothetical protein HanIR_Chr14g0704421 [Helianthus annuus]KAJ0840783.1 hypothetical protein HanPSC8_Chr14g0622951 [Helianthus annuus]KAJ0854198.1 hypothetical protein HanRHA438_Chr14g0659991 [Helianthus annuus]